LSFENIILNDSGELFFIDVIKSPIESPLFDLGRLSLDAKYGWWNANVESSIFSDLAMKDLDLKINTLISNFDIPHTDLIAYRLISAFRIMPYTLNVSRLAKLIRCVHQDGLLLREGIN
jgi:hypothetical protein